MTELKDMYYIDKNITSNSMNGGRSTAICK